MLTFDKTYALAIAIVFGLAGLPWGLWLFRKDKEAGLFEKTIVGYTLGIVLVPFLFLLQNIVGIMYSPTLSYVNWAAVFLAGAYFAFKDNAFRFEFDFGTIISQKNAIKIALFAIMLVSFAIAFSASGIPIMDLDPYFYLDGVKQVVYEGKNYANDMTAWYPLEISSHMGQPIWKYMLASWFSIYNGEAPYSPYIITGVASVYPPIIGALAAFFAYFLFSHLYNQRTGLLAAGILSFMPIMALKFQGGDFQIEPYNIFAFVFLFGAFAYALKYRTKESYALMAVSALCAFLASNLALLLLAVLSLAIFAIGISQFVQPSEEGEKRFEALAYFVAAVVAAQIVNILYNVAAGNDAIWAIRTTIPIILIPFGALASSWVICNIFSEKKNPLTEIRKRLGIEGLRLDLWSRFGVLAIIAVVGLFGFFIAQEMPVIGDTLKAYSLFGAYTEPLYRTIAEQAPGSEYYSGSMGFVAARLGSMENPGNDLAISAYSLASGMAGAINAIPNAVVNFVYGIFIAVMNSITGVGTFEKVDKGNSLMTAIVFFGILALVVNLIYSIYKKNAIALDALLILPFAIPVVLMAFGKAKLVMYLALAILFLAAVCWASIEKGVKLLLRWNYARKGEGADEKKKGELAREQQERSRIFRIGAVVAVIGIILAQFGPAYALSFTIPGQEPASGLFVNLAGEMGYGSLPLFVNSFEPRIYDNEVKVYAKLEKYCALTADSAICPRVWNWEETKNDPVKYYEGNLCARSLWPYADRAPGIGVQMAIGYRCSFVAPYWLDSMEWISKNVQEGKPGSRIISWWDYGHWINFFGQKDTVLRNEHGSTEMIGKTAAAFLHKDVEFLRKTMKEYDSKYALIDIEILGSGADKNSINLGGKYSALNYLGCAWMNKTTVEKWPGESECENSNLWETVFVPQQDETGGQPCTISAGRGLVGIIGYKMLRQNDGNSVPEAKYCFAQEYVNGTPVIQAYNLLEKDATGDLTKVEAEWRGYAEQEGIVLNAYYSTKDSANKAGAFYASNAYSAFFLDELEGFDLVYSSPQIRIFKMKDEYWN